MWRVPVAVQALGAATSTQVIVSGSGATPTTLTGCGPALLNVGQTGYFRSRYAPEVLRGTRRSASRRSAHPDQLWAY